MHNLENAFFLLYEIITIQQVPRARESDLLDNQRVAGMAQTALTTH